MNRSDRVKQLAAMAVFYRKVCKTQGVPHCARIAAAVLLAVAGTRYGSAPLALLLTTADEWKLGPATLGDGLSWLKGRGLVTIQDDYCVIVVDMTGVLS